MSQIKLIWKLIQLALTYGPMLIDAIQAIIEAFEKSKDPNVADITKKLREEAERLKQDRDKKAARARMDEIIRSIGRGGAW